MCNTQRKHFFDALLLSPHIEGESEMGLIILKSGCKSHNAATMFVLLMLA